MMKGSCGSSLAWSGKAPARLSAKNCHCSSTGSWQWMTPRRESGEWFLGADGS